MIIQTIPYVRHLQVTNTTGNICSDGSPHSPCTNDDNYGVMSLSYCYSYVYVLCLTVIRCSYVCLPCSKDATNHMCEESTSDTQ